MRIQSLKTLRIIDFVFVAHIFSTFSFAGIPGFSPFYLTLVLLALLLFFEKKIMISMRSASLAFSFLFSLVTAISLLWSSNLLTAIARLGHITLAFFSGYVIYSTLFYISNKELLRWGVLLSLMPLSITAILEMNNFSGNLLRVAGIAGNANSLALYLTFGSIIILNPIFYPKTKTWVLVGVAIIFSILITGSRKTIIAFPFFIVYYFSQKKRGGASIPRLFMFFVITVILLVFFSLYWSAIINKLLEIPAFYRTFAAIFLNEASADIRSEMIEEGLILWGKKPLLGHGPDQFASLSTFTTYSHNNYIEILSSAGLVGIFLFYGIYANMYRKLILSKDVQLKKYIATFLLLIILLDFTWVSYYSKPLWVLLGLFLYSLKSEIQINNTNKGSTPKELKKRGRIKAASVLQ